MSPRFNNLRNQMPQQMTWRDLLWLIPVLMFGFMYQLGARKLPGLILVPILSSPVFAVIFGRFMEVSLPRGMGLVRLLSFYIY